MLSLNTITLAGAFAQAHMSASTLDARTRQGATPRQTPKHRGFLSCLLAGLSRGSLRSA